ncbi:MAG TPA: RNA polymerase sigma factor [Micromonosporaceae bacterium]
MADDDAREAVREAYQAYYRRLVATLYGLTADYAEAQDLVQEAYARALARPKTFLDVTDPEAWLRTVAVNLARTRWRRRRLLDTMIRTGRVTPTPESVPGANPNRVLLIAALAKLNRPTRETIVLHHIADMSVQEVAEQLGVPVGTVKARLSRGRALLADLLHEAAPTAAVPTSAAPVLADSSGRRLAGEAERVAPLPRTGILPLRADRAAAADALATDRKPSTADALPSAGVFGEPDVLPEAAFTDVPTYADPDALHDGVAALDRIGTRGASEIPPPDTTPGETSPADASADAKGSDGLVPARGRTR